MDFFLYMKHLSLLLTLSLLTAGCTSTRNEEQKTIAHEIDKDISTKKDTEQVRIYSLPAPLQIPNEIKKHNPTFYEDLLNPTQNNPGEFSNNFKKAVNLGIYAVDLGYTTIYGQGQSAINYLAAAVKLADQLEIRNSIHPGLIERYKKNIGNKDSVNYLVIKSFSDINRDLTESNRQVDAALILTGSFIEGVHLSASIYEKNKSELMINLIGQQKLFLDNLLEILPSYENGDIGHLITDLKDLKKEYDKIEITYADSNDKNLKVIESIKASEQQVISIGSKVRQIRAKMLS